MQALSLYGIFFVFKPLKATQQSMDQSEKLGNISAKQLILCFEWVTARCILLGDENQLNGAD